MSEMKELKEAVVAGLVVGFSIYKEAKDGLQLGKDSLALVNDLLLDPVNRAKIAAGVDGLLKIGAELKGAELDDYLTTFIEVMGEFKMLKSAEN